jgi:hypothetical protein
LLQISGNFRLEDIAKIIENQVHKQVANCEWKEIYTISRINLDDLIRL